MGEGGGRREGEDRSSEGGRSPESSGEDSWLRSVYDEAPDAIYLADADGRILDVNHEACRSQHTTREGLIGTTIFNLMPARRRAEARDRFREWAAGAQADCEALYETPDGRALPVEIHVRPIAYRGEAALLFTVRDISRRKEAERQVVQAQKMEALGKLAGGIAHDFNNLLMVIMNNAAFVEAELSPDAPACEDLRELLDATRQAADLTTQLLCFSRKQMCRPSQGDLVQLLQKARPILEHALGEDIVLTMELPSRPLWVRIDGQLIEQGLLNLALNARDAMSSGGRFDIVARSVDLAAEDQSLFVESPALIRGRYVRLDLTDTGPGIDPSSRGRVFEPFFTTKPRSRGTGLGLSTTYGIVRQHTGYMALSTAPGRTTFSIYLPLVEAGAERAGPAVSGGLSEQRGGSETILLAEDSKPVRLATRRMLERLGYRVLEASNGFEALEVASRETAPIDLLFTDVVMPGMDGTTLAAKMRDLRPDTKVVFASGYPADHLQDQGVISGRVALLQKPFNGEQVARAVRSVLDDA